MKMNMTAKLNTNPLTHQKSLPVQLIRKDIHTPITAADISQLANAKIVPEKELAKWGYMKIAPAISKGL
jgi:hypothetical protein